MRKQLRQIKYSTGQGGEQVIKNITLRGNEDKGGGGSEEMGYADTTQKYTQYNMQACKYRMLHTHTPVHS